MVDPTRSLIFDGPLTVIKELANEKSKIPEIKERLVLLFSDSILITKYFLKFLFFFLQPRQVKKTKAKKHNSLKRSTNSASPSINDESTSLKIILFEELVRCKLILDENYPTSFIIQFSQHGELKFIVASKEERDSWTDIIIQYKNIELGKKNKSRENALSRSRDKAENAKDKITAFYTQEETNSLSNPRKNRSKLSKSSEGPEEDLKRTRSKTLTLNFLKEVKEGRQRSKSKVESSVGNTFKVSRI